MAIFKVYVHLRICAYFVELEYFSEKIMSLSFIVDSLSYNPIMDFYCE